MPVRKARLFPAAGATKESTILNGNGRKKRALPGFAAAL
jgi:hypothetical protein